MQRAGYLAIGSLIVAIVGLISGLGVLVSEVSRGIGGVLTVCGVVGLYGFFYFDRVRTRLYHEWRIQNDVYLDTQPIMVDEYMGVRVQPVPVAWFREGADGKPRLVADPDDKTGWSPLFAEVLPSTPPFDQETQ